MAMKIEQKKILVSDIVKDYSDDAELGVHGFGGKLDIRPPYQREFVYNDKERKAVINTLVHGFPLNTMYWMVRQDGTYEVLDGQQRTISICQYYNNDFSIDIDGNPRTYANLTDTEKQQFLDYELHVYFCQGTDKERLDWFQTINIAGKELSAQEIRNAVYNGPFIADAKRYFSKNNGPAYNLGKNYLSGEFVRQAYLETAIRWKAEQDGLDSIEDYMSAHMNDKNALPLWKNFQNVISWIQAIFPKYDKFMKGIDWGHYYNLYPEKDYKGKDYDAVALAKRVLELQDDDDVQSNRGIYEYLLDGQEKHLNLRSFSDKEKKKKYNEQHGMCPYCGKHFEEDQMEGDHILPWHDGGKTVYENLQMLCKKCNRTKSGK